MSKDLRFTGENPPPSLWTRFPNWENAYDEEGVPGQDETTLRPADNQQTIDDEISFTAGDAVLANGGSIPAFLCLLDCEPGWVYVYPGPQQDICWVLRYDVLKRQWVAMSDEWFLQGSSEVVPVPVDSPGIFPIRVSSRLPLAATGKPLVLEIASV